MQYIKRITDKEIEKKLRTTGDVVIKGPKWCGKTTTAEQFAKSVVYMDDPEKRDSYFTLAEHSPSRLLYGDVPRLIDE